MPNNTVDDGNANTFIGSGGLAITNVELPKTVNSVNGLFDGNRADKNGGGVSISNRPPRGHSFSFTSVVFQGITARNALLAGSAATGGNGFQRP